MPVDIGSPVNFSLAQLSLFFIETLRFCFCPCLQNAGSSPRGPTVSEADVQMQRELVRQQQEFLQQQQEQLAKSQNQQALALKQQEQLCEQIRQLGKFLLVQIAYNACLEA